MFVPTKPSTAGSSVTAAATVTATTAAAPMPKPLMKERPMANMPSSAMITVRPANSTARPDVSIAVIDGLLGIETGLQPLAVAGDDEQRVVDAHADADHRGQRRREALQRVHVREQPDDREPDRDSGDGHHDRHGHCQQ